MNSKLNKLHALEGAQTEADCTKIADEVRSISHSGGTHMVLNMSTLRAQTPIEHHRLFPDRLRECRGGRVDIHVWCPISQQYVLSIPTNIIG